MTESQPAVSVAQADWFKAPALQTVLALLNAEGGEGRVAGGAVRDSLMDLPVGDIDIATTLLPQEVTQRAEAAGIKVVPTGFEHGTVTLVVDGQPFEVTTLRIDVNTDGRHAEVAFGTDWSADAHRRDLTMNGLYADVNGQVIDLVGGIADIESRSVRFIGEADQRIQEDYLRIMRFFRFFAWYGRGRPDADGLRACARLRSGLDQLSAERVWSELKRLFAAPDPSRALLWMRQAGVLSLVLPESEKWGIDAIFGLIRSEDALEWEPDALLRVMAVVPSDADRLKGMAERLRLSNAESRRLLNWAAQDVVPDTATDSQLRRQLYHGDAQGILDQLKLRLSQLRGSAEANPSDIQSAASVSRLLAVAGDWVRPQFPLSGKDLQSAGAEPGPEMGKTLAALEQHWIESGFSLTRADLLSRYQKSS